MAAADVCRPLVSVIIPTYNAAATLGETLDSVFAQTWTDMEVIVVDDGSQDGSQAVLERFGDRVRVVRQANGGLASARNAGARLAQGRFIALMDADDLCEPERIALQVQALQAFPEAVLCCSDFSTIGAVEALSYERAYYSAIDEAGGLDALFGEQAALPGRRGEGPVEIRHGRAYDQLVFGNFIHPPTVMMRADTLVKVGFFDPGIRYNCDWECFVRMSRLGGVVHIDRALLKYRISRGQMSSWRHNRGEGAADLVTTAEKIWDADPSIEARWGQRVLACRRDFYSNAARLLADHDKFRSVRLLAWSVRYGSKDRDTFNTAVKLLLPSRMTRYMRERRVQAETS